MYLIFNIIQGKLYNDCSTISCVSTLIGKGMRFYSIMCNAFSLSLRTIFIL